MPQIVNAILSRHNFILLGLRGQAKSRILRALTTLLDDAIPIVAGSEVNDNPFAPISKYARKLLAEAGAGPEHIVRLTWYLTSKSEYQASAAGIGAAWKETLARNFPPSTLLYIDGLVDERAKVEIEVTAFVPAAVAQQNPSNRQLGRVRHAPAPVEEAIVWFETTGPDQMVGEAA